MNPYGTASVRTKVLNHIHTMEKLKGKKEKKKAFSFCCEQITQPKIEQFSSLLMIHLIIHSMQGDF